MKLGERIIEPVYTTIATSCDSIIIQNLKFKNPFYYFIDTLLDYSHPILYIFFCKIYFKNLIMCMCV